MKCRLLYLSLIILTNQHLVAQDFDFKNNPMQFSYKLPKQIDAIEKNERMIPYSTIGEYQKTLELADFDEEKAPILTQKDSLHFYNFKAQVALPYLIEQAKASKITIINEAHHNPRHRVFTTQLLKELYKEGYRYFGLEGLTPDSTQDEKVNTQKYPTLASGYYIVEPQFGNLIREALQLGFVLFSYESIGSGGGKKREIGQASSIKTFMDKHPDGKYLIHCGYDHVIEADIGGDWEKAMAGRLKEYTGINPFTINQVHLTEKSDFMYENPFFKKINESTPSVFLDKNGNVFNGPEGQNYVDVQQFSL